MGNSSLGLRIRYQVTLEHSGNTFKTLAAGDTTQNIARNKSIHDWGETGLLNVQGNIVSLTRGPGV